MSDTNPRRNESFQSLVVAQLNLQNSKLVTSQLRQTLIDQDIDILMAQEPYSVRGKVAGFGLTRSNIVVVELPGNERPYACAIMKPTINPLHMAQFHTTHTTVIRVEINKQEIFFVSSYFQFAHEMDPYLDQIKRILDALPGKPIVICADVNAKSEIWFNDRTDARGEQLENFIDQNDLLVINEPGQQSTHVEITLT